MIWFAGVQDEEAISCYSRLLVLAPNNELGHMGVGMKALQEGRYKDAIKDLTQGLFAREEGLYYCWMSGIVTLSVLLGLEKKTFGPGWHSLAEAQLKTHKYTDSASSCSQGTWDKESLH